MNRKLYGWLFVAVSAFLVGNVIWAWLTAGKFEMLSLLVLPGPLAGAERMLRHGPAKLGAGQ
jgi:hypothetical protein